MKKTTKTLLVAVILTVFFTVMPLYAQDKEDETNSNLYPRSDFNIPRFKDEFYIQPDINNPYQGTWIPKGRNGNVNYMYAIIGMEATQYMRPGALYGWRENGKFRVDDTWILSDNNNTLEAPLNQVFGKMLFERYIK